MNMWISTADRLPSHHNYVLVYKPECDMEYKYQTDKRLTQDEVDANKIKDMNTTWLYTPDWVNISHWCDIQDLPL